VPKKEEHVGLNSLMLNLQQLLENLKREINIKFCISCYFWYHCIELYVFKILLKSFFIFTLNTAVRKIWELLSLKLLSHCISNCFCF